MASKNTLGEASTQQKSLAVENLLLDEAVFWSCSYSIQMLHVVRLLDPSPLAFAEREMGGFFPTPGDFWPSILAFDPAFLVDCGLRMLSLLKD